MIDRHRTRAGAVLRGDSRAAHAAAPPAARRTAPRIARRSTQAVSAAMIGLALVGAQLVAPSPVEAQQIEARVWLDRGHEPVFHHGDRARLYYRTNRDAYVAIFRLDTSGRTRLLYPRSPRDAHFIRGGRDYRLTFPNSSWWHVDDEPGVGYYFAIASSRPFDFGAFTYAAYNEYGAYGWDLGDIYRTVYHDPYVAMDDLVAALVPDWRYSPYALDFATYHVGQRYDYPRFLCYDCHGYRSFSTWNPYLVSCTNFRVVIYNDPYYYPAYRYRGTRVVYVRPPVYRQPRFVFKERAYGEPARPVTTARPAIPVASPSVPPPVGRGLDGRVRRADPRTASTPQYGEPMRSPTSPPRRAEPRAVPGTAPGVRAPDTRPGASPGTRPSDATRPGVPAVGARPNGGPAVRGNTGSVLPPGTRPTRILPGRENADDIGIRRRGGETTDRTRPPRTGATGALPPGRVTPPNAAGPRTSPQTGPTRPPSQVRPPSRVGPPSQARPPSQVRPPAQAQPPSRIRPPTQTRPPSQVRPPSRPPAGAGAPGRVTPPSQSRPPARVRPPARPPGGNGSARPPTRPPTRPTGPGGGGARPPTRPPGGGGG